MMRCRITMIVTTIAMAKLLRERRNADFEKFRTGPAEVTPNYEIASVLGSRLSTQRGSPNLPISLLTRCSSAWTAGSRRFQWKTRRSGPSFRKEWI